MAAAVAVALWWLLWSAEWRTQPPPRCGVVCSGGCHPSPTALRGAEGHLVLTTSPVLWSVYPGPQNSRGNPEGLGPRGDTEMTPLCWSRAVRSPARCENVWVGSSPYCSGSRVKLQSQWELESQKAPGRRPGAERPRTPDRCGEGYRLQGLVLSCKGSRRQACGKPTLVAAWSDLGKGWVLAGSVFLWEKSPS